jgi:hypothetical protein
MRILVGPGGVVSLEDPDDFTRFAVVAASGVALPGGLPGIVRDADHAWVSPEALRRLAPQSGTPDWEAGFARMLAYAASKSWVNAEGAIRAHIETV